MKQIQNWKSEVINKQRISSVLIWQFQCFIFFNECSWNVETVYSAWWQVTVILYKIQREVICIKISYGSSPMCNATRYPERNEANARSSRTVTTLTARQSHWNRRPHLSGPFSFRKQKKTIYNVHDAVFSILYKRCKSKKGRSKLPRQYV